MTDEAGERATLDDEVRAGLRAAELDLDLEWSPGELRLLDRQGRAVARVVSRDRGGAHADVATQTGGESLARRLEARALPIVEARGTEWRTRTSPNPWSLPFDRGPGLYPLDEVDLGGIARRWVGERDVRVLYLEATCLADCVFCGHVEDDTDGLPERLALSCVEAGEIDVRDSHVLLGGPEPTVRSDLERWIAALRAGGAGRVSLIATGEPLADPHFARRLREAGLDDVSLPVYGGSAEVHDAITRSAGSFAALARTIAGAREAGLEVHMHGLLLRQNAAHLDELSEWAAREGHHVLLGLPRAKHELALEPYVPDAPTIRQALRGAWPGLSFGGIPLCLGGEDVDEERLDAWGPFLVYLGVQAGHFAEACAGCAVRPECAGLPVRVDRLLGDDLRPTDGDPTSP